MKKVLSTFIALVFASIVFAQDKKLKECSYSEFFKMIEETEDTIYRYRDAIIRFNPSIVMRERVKVDVTL